MIRSTLVRLRRVRELRGQIGTRGVARLIWRRLTAGKLSRIDVFEAYSFVNHPPFGGPFLPDTQRKTINWFVPDFQVGSGGHLNIFRLAYHLEAMDYDCRIIIVGPSRYPSAEAAQECIRRSFFPLKAQVWQGTSDVPAAWYSVATSWITAYFVRSFEATAHRIYFVQDFEPAFFAFGSEYILAENTYRFGFFGVTAGGWLERKLSCDYGMRTRAIGFAVERDRYARRPRDNSEARQVFFYARPPTPRRAFEIGLLVLAEIARKLPGVKFVLAGWDVSQYWIPFKHVNAGSVSLDELPVLYSHCDAALVLSCTNLSLLPLELMACGCPVVSNRGPNVEWLLTSELAVLADFTVEGLADAVVGLLNDETRRRALAERGMSFARKIDWHSQAERFSSALGEVESRHMLMTEGDADVVK